MAVMMSLVWLPLLVATIWALTRFGRGAAGRGGERDERDERVDARELARRTYARGEIDRARYLQIVEDLERDGAHGGRT
jgi:uncharacterized membrane protein